MLFPLALTATACKRVVTRIVVPADTLLVNSTDWTPLGFELVDQKGHPIAAPVTLHAVDPKPRVAISKGGLINCQEDGNGTIAIEAAGLRAERPIRCHLARRFGISPIAELVAGGPPTPLVVMAYDAAGDVIPEPRLFAVISDTTILRLANGLVYGLRAGTSDIRVRSGGSEGGQIFRVLPAATTRAHVRDTTPDNGSDARN